MWKSPMRSWIRMWTSACPRLLKRHPSGKKRSLLICPNDSFSVVLEVLRNQREILDDIIRLHRPEQLESNRNNGSTVFVGSRIKPIYFDFALLGASRQASICRMIHEQQTPPRKDKKISCQLCIKIWQEIVAPLIGFDTIWRKGSKSLGGKG